MTVSHMRHPDARRVAPCPFVPPPCPSFRCRALRSAAVPFVPLPCPSFRRRALHSPHTATARSTRTHRILGCHDAARSQKLPCRPSVAPNDTLRAASALMARREALRDFFHRKIGGSEAENFLVRPRLRRARGKQARGQQRELHLIRLFSPFLRFRSSCEKISRRTELPGSATVVSAIRAAANDSTQPCRLVAARSYLPPLPKLAPARQGRLQRYELMARSSRVSPGDQEAWRLPAWSEVVTEQGRTAT
jgi:hypothetical protein